MNYLIFGDLHIRESDFEELNLVLEEIYNLVIKYKVDKLIILGDTFDKVNPSILELNLFANFIKKVNKPMIIISAHSHESINNEVQILTHFGILNSNLIICNEYKDENHLYGGHWIVNEAKKNQGATKSKSELKEYQQAYLGHSHSWELIPPNICQLGSVRYISFSETEDKAKVVALIENYKNNSEKIHFLGLKTPYPMKTLKLCINAANFDQNNQIAKQDALLAKKSCPALSGKEIQRENEDNLTTLADLKAQLNQFSHNYKILIKLGNFEALKQFVTIEKEYKEKFFKFEYKLDFDLIPEKAKKDTNEKIKLTEHLERWLKENKIDEEVSKAIKEEIK